MLNINIWHHENKRMHKDIYLTWVSYRQHIIISCFSIHSFKFCLIIGLLENVYVHLFIVIFWTKVWHFIFCSLFFWILFLCFLFPAFIWAAWASFIFRISFWFINSVFQCIYLYSIFSNCYIHINTNYDVIIFKFEWNIEIFPPFTCFYFPLFVR